MRRFILALVLLFAFVSQALAAEKTYGTYVVVVPFSASYSAISGATGTFTRTDTSQIRTSMGFSGTSPSQVIDLSSRDIPAGDLSFQFQSLTGATGSPPTSGTTIGGIWRVSNIDSPAGWAQATANTIFSNINALTGATNIPYLISATLANGQSGVTSARFMRLEYTSGVSANPAGNGNLIPVGVLFGR